MAGERRKSKAGSVSDAIDRLAGLYEWGALQVATDPVAFLDRVAAEIRANRAAPAPPQAEPAPGCESCGGDGRCRAHPNCDEACMDCAGRAGRTTHGK